MATVKDIRAREVLDSRGNPTIEVTVCSENHAASAIVPSGASIGIHEALEIRDNDMKRYNGKGVLKAVKNVNTILKEAIVGFHAHDQRGIDKKLIELDGTPNKSNLGANALLGVSLACVHLGALEFNGNLFQYFNRDATLLPTPMMNVINGGTHADSDLDIQEFMIVPIGAPTFREALRMGAEVFHMLQNLLAEKSFSTSVGDEGGFAPQLASNETAFDILIEAIEKAGYKMGDDFVFAIDAAASEFYRDKKYHIKIKGKLEQLNSTELIDFYAQLIKKYPIFSIEDGLAEDDWDEWQLFTNKCGNTIQLVGDDLFVTNPTRLKRGIDEKIANSILIKLNQIGTVSETQDVITMAKAAGFRTIVSHRSGESEDTTIADLAVGMETGQIKTGSLSRTDRVAKYNQLLRIEEILGKKARYAGKTI